MSARTIRGAAISALGLALALGAGALYAQSLAARLTDQCVRATVKISAVFPGGTSVGSGSMIDARGYILTNFHVVGHTAPGLGTPGTLLIAENRFRVATVDSSRDAARPRWIAKVVRADRRLDLALLRIVSDEHGTAIRGAPFTAVKLGRTADLRPGSQVWAFGYPLGVRTINVTGGDVTGFQMNARNQVAWLRSDAEFNPGNSGGMLVDEHGRIVAVPTLVVRGPNTLEPVELARPTERIPAEWLTALRRGHIDDVKIGGVPSLQPHLPYFDSFVGDLSDLADREQYLYLLPDDRPAVVRLSKNIDVGILDAGNHLLRAERGEIEVEADDPPGLVLSVVVRSNEVTSFDIRFEPVHPPPVVVSADDAGEDGHGGGDGDGNGDGEEAAAPPPSPVATVIGHARDAANGRPLPAIAAIGRPGVDVRRALEAYQAGRMDDDELDAAMLVFVRSDVEGRFEIPGVPRGRTYSLLVALPGYRPVVTDVSVGANASLVEVPAVDLVANR